MINHIEFGTRPLFFDKTPFSPDNTKKRLPG